MRGFIGGKSTRNTRIERFWREYNTTVMKKFYDEFMHLEELGCLDRNDNTDLWVLHQVYLPVINEKLMELKTYFNDHPISTAEGKTPNQMYAISALRSQVINTSISAETIDILNNWQNVFSLPPRNNVIVPMIEAILMNEMQSNFVDTILSNMIYNPNLNISILGLT